MSSMNRAGLLAFLLVLTLAGVIAVRRTDDDEPEYDNYDASESESHAGQPDAASGDHNAKADPTNTESAEDPDAPARPSFMVGMAPVFAVMFASKTVPALDAGGSSIPMLVSVMIYPRLVAYIQEMMTDINFQEDDNLLMALNCAVALGVFSVVVNVGKSMGHFGPAGQETIGSPAGSLSELKMVQGSAVDVAKQGSVKVVEFWGTWCGPCKTAIPHLNKVWKDLTKEFGADKLQFVGVSQKETEEVVKAFITEMNGQFEYPVALDVDGTLTAAYPISGIPHAFVVGKDGMISWAGHPGGSKLEAAVRKAMAAEATPQPPPPATVQKGKQGKPSKAD
jgi:thiol-disulfide isomerase/thioredoxin